MGATLLDSEKDQLIRLRDEFRRNASSLSFPDVRSYMEDLIYGDLRGKLFKTQNDLVNPEPFSRAVWYCLCNNNADRNALVERLYAYFVNKVGVSDDKALDLISVVLFLGGVDFQISNVKKPEPVMSPPGPSSHVSNTPAKKRRWAVPAAIAAAAVVLLVLVLRACGNSGNNNQVLFTKSEVCRAYEGSIEMDNVKKTCQLSISAQNSTELQVIVSNVYNSADKKTYSAKIRHSELRLDHGPNLTISKTGQGKMMLNCSSRDYGTWSFISKSKVK